MPILLDSTFVTKADFVNFREMSQNITEAKLDIFIREAQLIEARSFLGEGLYLALQEDFDDTLKTFNEQRFTDLMYGVDSYTNYAGVEVRFNGYANAIVYWSFGRFLLQQQMNVSRFGVESVQNEISEDITGGSLRTKSKESLSVAIQYQKDCLQFLESNKSVYPEYVQNDTKPKRTSFTFFKV